VTEHCPACLSAARAQTEHQAGEQTVTTWRCSSCRREWETSYLTSAYGDEDEPMDEPSGYWDGPWPQGAS
jgi:transposase-like protein